MSTTLTAPNVSAESQAAFKKNHAKIIEMVVARLLAEKGQFDHLGDQAESTLSAGFEFTSANLETCMLINDAKLLIDQLRWSKDRLPVDGISMDRMAKNLQVYCEVIAELLPPQHSEKILTLIHQMMAAQVEIIKDGVRCQVSGVRIQRMGSARQISLIRHSSSNYS
jgi:hypothetical protein